MGDLQIVTPIGELSVTEVYVEYDVPRVFACESLAGHRFISFWIDEDSVSDTYMFVPVSHQRLSAIRIGRLTLREAILRSEDGWVWIMRLPYDESAGEVQHIYVTELTERQLPGEEAKLTLPDDRLPDLTDNPLVNAKRSLREQLLVSLEGPCHIHEIDADHLGQVASRTQSLVRALAYRDGNTRGRYPKRVLKNTTIVTTGLFAASFGIRFESKQGADMFGGNDIRPVLKLLMELFDAGSNRDRLLDVLSMIKPRSAIRYRLLLNTLAEGNFAMNVTWASPSDDYMRTYITLSSVRSTLATLREAGDSVRDTFKAHGYLDGVLLKKGYFEFSGDAGESYRGTISKQLMSAPDFQLPTFGIAEIEETVVINPITGADRYSYSLLDLERDPSEDLPKTPNDIEQL